MRVRKGLAERRATKTVIADAEVAPPAPPFTLRLFLQGWSLAVIAILVIGFAAALVALGSFTSADFIALAVPLTALLVVRSSVLRGPAEAPERRSAARGQSGVVAAPKTRGTGLRAGQRRSQWTPAPRRSDRTRRTVSRIRALRGTHILRRRPART